MRDSIRDYYANSKTLSRSVNIHLVCPNTDIYTTPGSLSGVGYPIQDLRNIALHSTTTSWVIYVESDMLFGPDAADSLIKDIKKIPKLGDTSSRILSIIPLYQFGFEQHEPKLSSLPSKHKLQASGFLPYEAESHRYMNFSHWEYDDQAAPLMLSHWDEICCPFLAGKPRCELESILHWWCFEPYYIAKKAEVPPFDPVLEFQTWDKLEQIKLMAATGH